MTAPSMREAARILRAQRQKAYDQLPPQTVAATCDWCTGPLHLIGPDPLCMGRHLAARRVPTRTRRHVEHPAPWPTQYANEDYVS